MRACRRRITNQPFATANCTSCHDPHQSAAPKLMRQFTASAVRRQDRATSAMRQPRMAKSCLRRPTRSRCASPATTKKPSKLKARRCLIREQRATVPIATTRMPAASPACPRPTPSKSAWAATPIRLSRRKKHNLHQPAFKQGCATCHEPHGGDKRSSVACEDSNTLCLECHGPDSQPKKLEAEHVLTIFNGSVKLPDDYFAKNKVVVLPLKFGRGHPIDRPPGVRCDGPDGSSRRFTPRSIA